MKADIFEILIHSFFITNVSCFVFERAPYNYIIYLIIYFTLVVYISICTVYISSVVYHNGKERGFLNQTMDLPQGLGTHLLLIIMRDILPRASLQWFCNLQLFFSRRRQSSWIRLDSTSASPRNAITRVTESNSFSFIRIKKWPQFEPATLKSAHDCALSHNNVLETWNTLAGVAFLAALACSSSRLCTRHCWRTC